MEDVKVKPIAHNLIEPHNKAYNPVDKLFRMIISLLVIDGKLISKSAMRYLLLLANFLGWKYADSSLVNVYASSLSSFLKREMTVLRLKSLRLCLKSI